jgi:hypothetical protein
MTPSEELLTAAANLRKDVQPLMPRSVATALAHLLELEESYLVGMPDNSVAVVGLGPDGPGLGDAGFLVDVARCTSGGSRWVRLRLPGRMSRARARIGTAIAAGAAQIMPMTVGLACSEATMMPIAMRPGGTVAQLQYMNTRALLVARADMAGMPGWATGVALPMRGPSCGWAR